MSKKLINVVLDLETLGTSEDAAIIQIGCCIPTFDRGHILGLPYEFEATIAYERCLNEIGIIFTRDNETMEWWETQPTRKQVFSGQDTYTRAFDDFCAYILDIKQATGGDVAIWGNGSDFDNRLLAYSLSALGYKPVWSFRNNRDLRTLKALFPLDVGTNLEGETKHTALGDARYEARLLHSIHTVYWESCREL